MATTDDADVEIARRHAERMSAGDEASRALGITLMTRPRQGDGEDARPAVDGQRSRVGHGGYLFLLADTAFAFACNTYGPVTVARNCESRSSGRWSQGKELTAAATERLKNTRNASTTSPCSAEMATWWPSCAGTAERFPPKRRDAGSI